MRSVPIWHTQYSNVLSLVRLLPAMFCTRPATRVTCYLVTAALTDPLVVPGFKKLRGTGPLWSPWLLCLCCRAFYGSMPTICVMWTLASGLNICHFYSGISGQWHVSSGTERQLVAVTKRGSIHPSNVKLAHVNWFLDFMRVTYIVRGSTPSPVVTKYSPSWPVMCVLV